MLKQIDLFHLYFLIGLSVVYLINTVYFGNLIITVTVIILAILLELFHHRHTLKKLSYAQLSIVAIVFIAGISGIIYMFVLVHIFVNPLSFPVILESALFLAFLLIGYQFLVYLMKKLFADAMEVE